MCLDQERRIIYVFGGLTLQDRSSSTLSPGERRYSGFYEYDIANGEWRRRREDAAAMQAAAASAAAAAAAQGNGGGNTEETKNNSEKHYSV